MSVYKRKDGKGWRAVVGYRTPEGEYRRLCAAAKTRKKAIAKELEMSDRLKGMSGFHGIHFVTLAGYFLEDCENKIRTSTLQHYRKLADTYLIPFFGSMEFEEIDKDDVDRWKKGMLERKSERCGTPLSLQYLKHAYKVLHLIFAYAEAKKGLVNPACTRSGNFRKDPNAVTVRKKLSFWTPSQFRLFLDRIEADMERMGRDDPKYFTYAASEAMLAICFFTGLRKGEANALRVSDISFGDGIISVTKSVSQQIGTEEYLVTNPKSSSSVRKVPIPETLKEILKRHIGDNLSCFGEYTDDPYVTYGVQAIPNSTVMLVKNRVEKEAGLPHIRIHDLRHSFVSMLVNAGTPVTTIAKLCGHSSPDLTYRVYAELFPDTVRNEGKRIDEIFRKESGKEKKENE